MFLFRSFKLFDAFGIPVRIHGSLVFFLLALSFLFGVGTGGVAGFFLHLAVMALAFGFVLLHELGHCLTAKAFGIPVRQITLYPIGGIAGIENLPRSPRIEFLVTVAGPAVNIVLAGLFGIVFAFYPHPIVFQLLFINLVFGFFNLLPGFPMDGGRILRALLARKMPYARATEIAVKVGRTTAIAMGVFGLLTLNLILVAISIFVYTAAGAELTRVRMEEAMGGRGPMNPADLFRSIFSAGGPSRYEEDHFEEERPRSRVHPSGPFRVYTWRSGGRPTQQPPPPTPEPRVTRYRPPAHHRDRPGREDHRRELRGIQDLEETPREAPGAW